MLNDFQVYNLAKEFYWGCLKLKLRPHFRDQMLRASSAIAMNIAEGSGKRTPNDQARYYSIAMGSLRECQSILDLEQNTDEKLLDLADRLGAILFKLTHKNRKPQTERKRQTPNPKQ